MYITYLIAGGAATSEKNAAVGYEGQASIRVEVVAQGGFREGNGQTGWMPRFEQAAAPYEAKARQRVSVYGTVNTPAPMPAWSGDPAARIHATVVPSVRQIAQETAPHAGWPGQVEFVYDTITRLRDTLMDLKAAILQAAPADKQTYIDEGWRRQEQMQGLLGVWNKFREEERQRCIARHLGAHIAVAATQQSSSSTSLQAAFAALGTYEVDRDAMNNRIAAENKPPAHRRESLFQRLGGSALRATA